MYRYIIILCGIPRLKVSTVHPHRDPTCLANKIPVDLAFLPPDWLLFSKVIRILCVKDRVTCLINALIIEWQ